MTDKDREIRQIIGNIKEKLDLILSSLAPNRKQ